MFVRRTFLALAFLLLFSGLLRAAVVTVVDVDGVIGPASTGLIQDAITAAEQQERGVVVIRLDTPGGLSDSMREIVKSILTARVPVITYVSPQGARAASAGTYILYASHLAAMSPATNLGAATPVRITAPVSLPGQEDSNDSSMQKKLLNDSIAYIRGLAEKRGRNAEWAELAVREGATLTSEQALDEGVIDFIAADLESLLTQLNGHTVDLPLGTVTLELENIVLDRVQPDWRQQLLGWITDPNVAYILMLLGVYGLIFELSNPGAILPGVVGAVSLLLALYAFQVLPVNSAGLALAILGLIFIISEVFVTSGGILGLGGVAAFVAGSVMLFDDDYLAVSIPLIGGTALVAAVFLFWILGRMIKLRRARLVSGQSVMIGEEAKVVQWKDLTGRVRFQGVLWSANSHSPLKRGQQVVIRSIDELNLYVEPL